MSLLQTQNQIIPAPGPTPTFAHGQYTGYNTLEHTVSICPECLSRVDATIATKGGAVYLIKNCPIHGEQILLHEENAAFYQARHLYDKPGTESKIQTQSDKGCPFDCGLCPEHDQHTCIGLIEVNSDCQLSCPHCYTGNHEWPALDLPQIGRMMDFFQDAESGRAEVVQISGGEPALHPQILDIIRMAKDKRFKYILLNTNGIRIAEDRDFAQALAAFLPRFEVYLQFDGMGPDSHTGLREHDFRAMKEKAIQNLSEFGIPITLVATIKKGSNDGDVGAILRYGMNAPCVRGVNYQPLGYFTKACGPPPPDRITLTGILEQIERQTDGEFRVSDFVPLPCDVERVALTFCYRDGKRFMPITRRFDLREYLPVVNNTFAFDADEYLAVAAGTSSLCQCMRGFLDKIRPLVPAGFEQGTATEKAGHFTRNMFRISISSFVDIYNFDLRSMQKECVHVITPDLRRIPFSAYNMFHRHT